ncbi:hypothetical protein ABTL34_19605, partial [Acinetobacter baumannii]
PRFGLNEFHRAEPFGHRSKAASMVPVQFLVARCESPKTVTRLWPIEGTFCATPKQETDQWPKKPGHFARP